MGLVKVKGNMYRFITHRINPIKGKCIHGCNYCYMGDDENRKSVRLDEAELKTNLGSNNFIFMGTGCDMFAKDVPTEWLNKVFDFCRQYENKYFFQSKNPHRFLEFNFPPKTTLCATIETNRDYHIYNGIVPTETERAVAMSNISLPKMITIEPIMDFDVEELFDLIAMCRPYQVNIGADSYGHKLPEPNKDKILGLIDSLKPYVKVYQKSNLRRLLLR